MPLIPWLEPATTKLYLALKSPCHYTVDHGLGLLKLNFKTIDHGIELIISKFMTIDHGHEPLK